MKTSVPQKKINSKFFVFAALISGLLIFSLLVCKRHIVYNVRFIERPASLYLFSNNVQDEDISASYNKGLHDEHCPATRSDMINIHIIAHSHDDVGWLKTVDQYYYGSRDDIQNAGVRYIIDGVVRALDGNPDRKYVQVEMAYLWRWWKEQNDMMKDKFRKLLKAGQIEIVCAGWSMADEATTDYVGLIDDHTFGFEFINKEIDPDYRPLVQWQIDPFGHSKELASLSAEFGMNALYFSRLDYQDRKRREDNRSTEFVWELRPSTPQFNLTLFTGIMARATYCPPPNFSFDIFSNDPPVMDDPDLEDYNADVRVGLFEFLLKIQQAQYPTNNLMLTMGCDFNYGSASHWFTNLDSLIRSINKMSNQYHAFYSSPSCYTSAVHKSLRTSKLESVSDDFFPYANDNSSFWTGYFTSRPSLKGMARQLNSRWFATRQVLTRTPAVPNISKNVTFIKDTIGVMQHHDSVSGTSKQHVSDDDMKRCSISMDYSGKIINLALHTSDIHFCPLLNETYCDFTEANSAKGFNVIVYNSLAENTSTWLRIPITGSSDDLFVVEDMNGNLVPSDMIPVLDWDIGSIPTRNGSHANFELVFKVNLVALGTTTVKVMKNTAVTDGNVKMRKIMQNQMFSNGKFEFEIDSAGKLAKITNLVSKLEMDFSYQLGYYHPEVPPLPTSGAYRFTPDASGLHLFDNSDAFLLEGKQVVEIHTFYSEWAKSITRIYANESFVEFQWLVGSIPISYGTFSVGREVVALFSTSINNQGMFKTDSNGREMLLRKKDYRSTWKFEPTQEVSENYYPVVSRLSISDSKMEVAVVNDRAQGGSGFRNGTIELMVHRRLTYDDNFGVGEPLLETGLDGEGLVATGKHWLTFETPQNSAKMYRKLSQKMMFQPQVMFSSDSSLKIDPITVTLPENLHLLTLERDFMNCKLLVRFEHLFEKGEDEHLSQPVSFDLLKFVKGLTGSGITDPITVTELALGANMPVEDNVRVKWGVKGQVIRKQPDDWNSVEMLPMQIRTFCIN